MTREEAKQILLCFRPGVADEADAETVQALKLAEKDSELQQWLEKHREFQRSVREQLRQTPVPEGLKARILAERPGSRSIWQKQEFLALAASIALLLSLAGYWLARPAEETFANFQSRMVGFALRTYEMDILSPDETKVREYLASHGAPADFALTPGLARMPVKGGGRLSWRSHPVGMVCFDLPQNETLYMFVMDRAAVPDGSVPVGGPQIIPGKHLSTATWSDGRRIYLLAAPTDAQSLGKLAERRG